MSSSWPTELGEDVNQFTFAKLDPDADPPLRVATWSNVFGEGGSVQVDAKVTATREDGTTYETTATLAAIRKEHNGSVAQEREHLQTLLDNWNENPADNWATVVNNSRARVYAYYTKQAKEAADKLAEMKAGAW